MGEGALYTFAKIFLQMGKTSQARTLLNAPGLRYNDSIVKGVCRSLQDSPVALEEFLKLCIPLFVSDQDFLFEKLINLVAEDPDKVIDAWEVMQEVFFTPNNTMLKQMALVLKSHGREIPFVIEEQGEETKEKKKAKKKTESIEEEQGEEAKK